MDYYNINEQLISAQKIMTDNNVEGTFAFFGSARIKSNTEEYKRAVKVAKAVSKAFPDYHICGGGGPGLMEAFNKGATNTSIGMGIELPFESKMNKYVDIPIMFEHFFIRKYWLLHSAKAALAFEGGIGTLDEIMETLVLIQTGKIKPIPIVLVGEEYWNRIIDWDYLAEQGLISKSDFDLFIISNDINTIVQYLKENIDNEHTIN
jgi:uncharacterized protein (TIGR00730 family)